MRTEIIRYDVIIGNPKGCHTVEHYSVEGYARLRVKEWQAAGYAKDITLRKVILPLGLKEPTIETLAI